MGKSSDQGTKKCTRCARTLPLAAFTKRTDTADGLERHCRWCQTQIAQTARANAKRAMLAARERNKDVPAISSYSPGMPALIEGNIVSGNVRMVDQRMAKMLADIFLQPMTPAEFRSRR
jgi:hypothetical protein